MLASAGGRRAASGGRVGVAIKVLTCPVRAGGRTAGHGAQQRERLAEVQQARVPVEPGAPDGERPAEHPGQPQRSVLAGAPQDQRERVQQAEGARLAQEVNRQRGVSTGLQRRDQQGDHHLATQQDDHQPPGDDLPQRQADEHREDVEPVGDRVEHLAQSRRLVPAPGEEAVQPVGEAGGREHQHRQPVRMRTQDQIQHQSDAGDAEQAQHIGQRPDPVGVVAEDTDRRRCGRFGRRGRLLATPHAARVIAAGRPSRTAAARLRVRPAERS